MQKVRIVLELTIAKDTDVDQVVSDVQDWTDTQCLQDLNRYITGDLELVWDSEVELIGLP